MYRRSLWLLLVGVLLLVPSTALAEETGTISGTVKNGTAGGGSVAGLNVVLNRYRATELVQSYSATTDESGHFEFTDLPIADGEAYLVTVTYQGVDYPSGMFLLTENPQPTADVTVHEPTTDPSVISLDSRGVVISQANADQGTLEVIEILAISNASDRAYVGTTEGEDKAVLKLPLPAGAAQIQPQPGFNFGEDARIEGGALITTGAIPPGEQTAVVAYRVGYTGTETTLDINTAMPTKTLRVLAREGTYAIDSPMLNDSGTVPLREDTYNVLAVDNPRLDVPITVSVSGLPKARGGEGGLERGPIYAALAAGVGLAAGSVLIYQTLRRRTQVLQPDDEVAAANPTVSGADDDQRLQLAAELNELDEELAAGNIDEATYQEQRQEILADLRALTQRRHGLEDAGA